MEFQDYRDLLSFAYGNLLAFHYYEEYLKDEQRTKENVLSMSLSAKDYDRPYLLDNFGLTSKQLTDTRVLEKRLSQNYHY